MMALGLAAAVFLALRPPYSVRQLERGLAHYQSERYESALECLNNSLRADSKSSEARFARGRVHQRLGDFHLAVDDFVVAYELRPNPNSAPVQRIA